MSAAPNLSLFQLSANLLDLYRLRDEVAGEPDKSPEDQKASLAAIDAEIAAYIVRNLEAADSIKASLNELAIRIATCKAAAKAEKMRADMWEAHLADLEAQTIAAMTAAGKRTIETARTTLVIKSNPPSCEIVAAEQVPKAYARRTIEIGAELWDRLQAFLMTNKEGQPIFAQLQQAKVSLPEPMLKQIKDEITNLRDMAAVKRYKKPFAKLSDVEKQTIREDPDAAVAGARLVEDRVRLVVE